VAVPLLHFVSVHYIPTSSGCAVVPPQWVLEESSLDLSHPVLVSRQWESESHCLFRGLLCDVIWAYLYTVEHSDAEDPVWVTLTLYSLRYPLFLLLNDLPHPYILLLDILNTGALSYTSIISQTTYNQPTRGDTYNFQNSMSTNEQGVFAHIQLRSSTPGTFIGSLERFIDLCVQ